MNEREGLFLKFDKRDRTASASGYPFVVGEMLYWDLFFGVSVVYPPSYRPLIQKIVQVLEKGPNLEEIGRGADMVAYSRPDLDFIIKFPYDDDYSIMRPRFSPQIKEGFFLAQVNLGGLFVPMTDIPTTIEDQNGERHYTSVIVQQKVKVACDAIDALPAREKDRKTLAIKRQFARLTQRVWERGVLDQDPNWWENTGFLPNGTMVMIDIGELSEDFFDFLSYEGMRREHLYDRDLRPTFDTLNFAQHFRKKRHEIKPVPALSI